MVLRSVSLFLLILPELDFGMTSLPFRFEGGSEVAEEEVQTVPEGEEER